MKKVIVITLSVLTASGCANSPARLSLMSDSEISSNFQKEDIHELCRVYLRGIKHYLEKPTSKLASSGARANAMIEAELKRRGHSEKYCANSEAIKSIVNKIESERRIEELKIMGEIEHNRRMEELKAGAPKIIIESTPQRCISNVIGGTVFTNCN